MANSLHGAADHLDVAIQSVTGSLKQLIDDIINNLDIQSIVNMILRKATDLHTYIDFTPGLGPQDRSPGASPGSEMEFQDAEEEPPPPAWQKYVDILFEVDNQYPDELKYVGWGLITFSCITAMGLLVLQSFDTRW